MRRSSRRRQLRGQVRVRVHKSVAGDEDDGGPARDDDGAESQHLQHHPPPRRLQPLWGVVKVQRHEVHLKEVNVVKVVKVAAVVMVMVKLGVTVAVKVVVAVCAVVEYCCWCARPLTSPVVDQTRSRATILSTKRYLKRSFLNSTPCLKKKIQRSF